MGISTLSVKQMEYKNAELVLIEFMSLQTSSNGETARYQDFNLQEFHDFVADKIEALDPIIGQKRGPYQKGQGRKSTQDGNQTYSSVSSLGDIANQRM